MKKTAAWPLAAIYATLIIYASLYPFQNWRSQGVDWTAFVMAPWPQYWTGFDVLSNVLGYAPLGFIVALALQRSARHLPAVGLTLALGSLLALGMESLQLFLPARVPSNVDWGLNSAGTLAGAGATTKRQALACRGVDLGIGLCACTWHGKLAAFFASTGALQRRLGLEQRRNVGRCKRGLDLGAIWISRPLESI